MATPLILQRAPIGNNQDDFDVLEGGVIVGRISLCRPAMEGKQWVWSLAYGHHKDRTPTHGYAESREAAIAAFAKSWRK